MFVLRRLVRFASEDIGLADPQALIQCLAAKDAYDFLGSPEGELAIVQACLYCATAPKSNAAYVAQKTAFASARETGSLAPPSNILNAPTKLMKDIAMAKAMPMTTTPPTAFPVRLLARRHGTPDVLPSGRARFEREVIRRIEWWDKRRNERRGNDSSPIREDQ